MSKIEKLYYKISEISRITKIEEYKLRYWESKIPILKPKRIQGNQRLYTQKEINLIEKIQMYLKKGIKLEAISSYILGKRKQVLYLNNHSVEPLQNPQTRSVQTNIPSKNQKTNVAIEAAYQELQKIVQRIDTHYEQQ